MEEGRKRLPLPTPTKKAVEGSVTFGMDLSISGTGICSIGRDGKTLLASVFKSAPVEGVGDIERFTKLAEKILGDMSPKPEDVIVLENYAFDASGQITRIAEFAGIVKHLLVFKYGVPEKHITFAAPTTVKKFITGKGVSEKDLMMKSAFTRWGQDFDNNNIVDAYGLAALGHAARYGKMSFPDRPMLNELEVGSVNKYKSSNSLYGKVEKKVKRRKAK